MIELMNTPYNNPNISHNKLNSCIWSLFNDTTSDKFVIVFCANLPPTTDANNIFSTTFNVWYKSNLYYLINNNQKMIFVIYFVILVLQLKFITWIFIIWYHFFICI